MGIELVTENELEEFLSGSYGWKLIEKSLVKEFTFSNFTNALAFVLKCGIEAEKIDHHPDMLIYSWNKVRISISTHSLGGITKKDFLLAQLIDKID